MKLMNRRTLLGLMGSGVGSMAVIGSGAFNIASAEREVTVDVVRDSDAYLKLDAVGPVNRSSDGDLVRFDIPGLREGEGDEFNEQNPTGVNSDAITRLSGVDSTDGLLAITNQGTEPIDVYAVHDPGPKEPEIGLFNIETGDLLTESSPLENLTIGEEVRVGIEIDATDISVGEYSLVLTLVGETSNMNS